MGPVPSSIHGRGAAENPAGRFERLEVELEPEAIEPGEAPRPATIYLRDSSRSVIASNDSPDVGFSHSINPYRGCSHGCIYCYARPTHEHLGFSAGLDFETRILVKMDAPRLLRKELSSRRWRPVVLGMCGVTDAYQPVERELQLTRQCLQVLAEFRNPVSIATKNHLVTRDIDILSQMARQDLVAVSISITTLDQDLTRIMEPRTAVPRLRLDAIKALSSAGVPVSVLVAPVIPGLTDHEMPAILEAAAAAGATSAGYEILRLPHGVKDLFQSWLSRHMPDRMEKVLSRIRQIRGGQLNDPRFGTRMRGEGVFADHVRSVFDLCRRRFGLDGGHRQLSTAHFRRPDDQPGLFGPAEAGSI